jgi:CheY-like chemotaxis protein
VKRILMVDDDAASCEAATSVLQREFDCAVDPAAREQAFTTRHQVIDRLRSAREQRRSLTATQTELLAVLEEVDRLQLVAHAADQVVLFPSDVRQGPEAVLQGALRFWKA